jgi:hypothetical protein
MTTHDSSTSVEPPAFNRTDAGSTPARATTPADVATAIHAAWASYLERGRRPQSPHPHVYASAWRPCVRRMVYDMTDAEKLPPWPVEVLAKFRRGDDRERDLLIDLARVGRDAEPPFEVVGQQVRFELLDRRGRVAIVGKVDAQIKINGWLAPLEVKAWSPFLVDRIERFADLFDNKWTIAGAYQLLSYLWGANEPYGFLLLDRSGLPLLLPVELDAHLDRMEDFLTRAETAIDHQRAGTLPDYLVGDAAECQRCPYYGSVCNPPIEHVGATLVTDPDLEAMLDRHHALTAAGREYNDLDRSIKERLRGVERGIVGSFLVEGRWQKQSRLDLPADVKQRYTVTDPKGKFRLEITKV